MVEVRELVAATKNQTPGQELQPKEVIATNAQIREHMRQLNEDYKELERLFLKEKNKRKVWRRRGEAFVWTGRQSVRRKFMCLLEFRH